MERLVNGKWVDFRDSEKDRAACTRKRVFESQGSIEKYTREVFALDGTTLSYYKCTFCNKYHLTSKGRYR